ncbi:MAG TPA: hypothetical protein VGB82_24985 [Alphaproteobacteria bacterium]
MTTHRFEVAIYNETIKKSVREGEPNRTGLSDEWADTRYIEVRADTPDAAKRKIHVRYPEHRGFVVLEVRQID